MENAKTIKGLLNAVPLSDGDFLPVNQPQVYNPITQHKGDTRKISIKKFMDFIFGHAKFQKIVAQVENLKELIPQVETLKEIASQVENLKELASKTENLIELIPQVEKLKEIATDARSGLVTSNVLGGNVSVDSESGIMSVNGWQTLASRIDELEKFALRGGFDPPPPPPPTVSAGTSITITLPTNLITLFGNATSNGGFISSVQWTIISGPNTPSFANASSLSTNVTGLVQGSYVFRLTVTDNHKQSTSSDVSVTVNPVPSGVSEFTSNSTFTVPNGVSQIKVTACAAGGGGGKGNSNGSGGGGGGGDAVVNKIYSVTAGSNIGITVGSGATIIGSLLTLNPGSKGGDGAGINKSTGGKAGGSGGGDGGSGPGINASKGTTGGSGIAGDGGAGGVGECGGNGGGGSLGNGGGGASDIISNNTQASAGTKGGGGGGGASKTTAVNGGGGGSGYVKIEWGF